MNLGNTITERRKKLNLSQEQLAQKMNVSRSAVAKWETNKGYPDIENLKALSQELDISINILLDMTENNDEQNHSNNADFSMRDEKIKKYFMKRCTVELIYWNDGIFDGYLFSQDEEFVYYVIPKKKQTIVGILAKKYITKIDEYKKKDRYEVDIAEYMKINRNYFIGKKVNLNLNQKHIWDGIIGQETEYINVMVESISNNQIVISSITLLDKAIQLGDVVKIEIA